MILTTYIAANKQDYIVANGIIQQNNALLTEAYTRIITPLGKYIEDPTFGSRLTEWINGGYVITNTITSEIMRCLRPMKDNRSIKDASVVVTAKTNNAIYLTIKLFDLQDKIYTLDVNYVGQKGNISLAQMNNIISNLN